MCRVAGLLSTYGNAPQEGGSVTVIKNLKIKGSLLVVKVSAKVKNIRLVESDHNIDCKIHGIGATQPRHSAAPHHWQSHDNETAYRDTASRQAPPSI